MRRALVLLGVLVRSAARGIQTSPLPSAIAIATIAVALLLVGSFALLVLNMQGLVERFSSELHVVVYLERSLDDEGVQALAARARRIEGVSRVDVVTRDEALARFRENLGGADLLEGLEDNPLPASLEIELAEASRHADALDRVVASVSALEGVDDLAQGQDWIEGYARLAGLVRAAAWGLGAILSLAALAIVANTIRLAVYAREDELEILSLVGAGRTFLRTPFWLEGLAQGLAGGVVALLLLYLGFRLLLPQLEWGLELFLGNARPRFFAVAEAAWLLASGAAVGVVGAGLAVMGWQR